MESSLNDKQWRKIAESLVEYIENMCFTLRSIPCYDCPFYEEDCEGISGDKIMEQVKKELGYE